MPTTFGTSSSARSGTRLKVRRGTASCWECRRRKVRCDFSSSASSLCDGCRRRGTACIAQTAEDINNEQPYTNSVSAVEERLDRLEVLVEGLLERSPQENALDVKNVRTRITRRVRSSLNFPSHAKTRGEAASNSIAIRRARQLQRAPGIPRSRTDSLSSTLYCLFPPSSTVALILRQGHASSFPLLMVRAPYAALSRSRTGKEFPNPATYLPDSDAHPIILAHSLVQLAVCLQQWDSETNIIDLGVSGSTRNGAKAIVTAVTQHVISWDSLIYSIDGLQILMLQGLFYLNSGEWKSAWAVFRRAVEIASLIGLHKAFQEGSRGSFLWFRLVYIDRIISLMLGLSAIAVDDSTIVNEQELAAEMPHGQLERCHLVAMGRLAKRNEMLRRTEQHTHRFYEETKIIDSLLKLATKSMHPKWWIIPGVQDGTSEGEALHATARLMAQVHHYYLLLLAHKPYISAGLWINQQSDFDDQQATAASTGSWTYYRDTALTASREIVSRFLVLREFGNIPACSRGTDLKALVASITILLSHIADYGSDSAHQLEHQRPSDLGMVEQAALAMEDIASSARRDILGISAAGAPVLKRLLVIEAMAFEEGGWCIWRSNIEERSRLGRDPLKCSIVDRLSTNLIELTAPNFGMVFIGTTTAKTKSFSEDSQALPGTLATRRLLLCGNPC